MTQPRVLIVEDETIIAWDLRLMLENWGVATSAVVEKGADAIRVFDREGADLVLLDIFLADSVSGIDVAHYIKEHSETPFIFVTASQDPGTMELALAEKPAAVIPKPYDRFRLKAEIMKALGMS
jgi:CheY-like chemotaxis protein